MAVAKSLSQAPVGLGALASSGSGLTSSPFGAMQPLTSHLPADPSAPALEIQIEDPKDVKINGQSILPDEEGEDKDEDFGDNLVDELDEGALAQLATDLIADFEEDVSSRKDWINTYVDGLELLGMKVEDRTEPWPGACGVYHPILAEALVKFQAETIMETFPAAGPVRTKIIGEETPDKKQAAVRVEEDMNYQLTERMVEYRPEHERMLWGLGLSGNSFKKVYFDPSLGRQTSVYVTSEDMVVPYGASNLQTAERVTHVMRKTPNEVKKLQAQGFYARADLGEPMDTLDEIEKAIAEKMGFRATSDDRFKLLEMHVNVVLPGYKDPYADPTVDVDGDDEEGEEEDDDTESPEEDAAEGGEEDDDDDAIALPYVITIEKGTTKVLSIRRNWDPDDDLKQKRNHFVHYPYIPGFGFYAFGLIHLIGAFAKSGTSLIRQLVDAGTLSNLPGGFKTKGLRIKGDDTPIGPSEWRDVDVASGTMRDNIMPLPYKEPSQVLLTLLGNIVDEGRRFASSADMQASDMSANSPVGTTLAILERQLKVMSAVQARVHYAMKQEFRLLKAIIRDHAPADYAYTPQGGTPQAKQADYDAVDVIPVSDPNSATMAQKVVQYQAVIQMAQQAPQIYDLPFLHRQMLDVLGVKEATKLVPMANDQQPMDPVSENMAVLNGKPVKAFIYQDHDAHIAVHQAAMQDPVLMATMGQNPKAPIIMQAAQAHIMEHIAFAYRKRIEDAAGVPYPAPDQPMDPNTETEISRLAAAAAKQVLQTAQSQQAAQQAQQTAQDPIVQMQQQELAIKQAESEMKKQKLAIDAARAADQTNIERERIASQERIAGLQVGAKVGADQARIESQEKTDGLRIGTDVAKAGLQGHVQQQMQAQQHTHEHAQNTMDHVMSAVQAAQASVASPQQPGQPPAETPASPTPGATEATE